MKEDFWEGKRVLVTGHTGFKGSWLSILLTCLGAKVSGFSLPPTSENVIYKALPDGYFQFELLDDLANRQRLENFIQESRPEIIFHLAAQASVLESLRNPTKTWVTNVNGTQNLLDSLSRLKIECTCVIVTTDKVYQNSELNIPFKESDPLGGKDPYSSSKAAVELLVNAYNSSYPIFQGKICLSTARAGNVIGGGDWLENRIIPDLVRAYVSSNSLLVRNPNSVRPWQHVLDALHGYLLQAEYFANNKTSESNKAFNFGPSEESQFSVEKLIHEFSLHMSIKSPILLNSVDSLESKLLSLNSNLAANELSWTPTMNFKSSVRHTATWYKASCENGDPYLLTLNQVSEWLSNEF